MISKREVEDIAQLARLGLSSAEIAKHQKELSAILDYVKKLKKVNVADVKATSHPLAVENAVRKDESLKCDKKLLNGYLKVKKILQ